MPQCRHLVVIKPEKPWMHREVSCAKFPEKKERSIKKLCERCQLFSTPGIKPKLARVKRSKNRKIMKRLAKLSGGFKDGI